MKAYHIFFLILKIGILTQFALILLNKESVNSKIYIFTKILFKLTVGLFIEILMFHGNIVGLAFEDKVVISFAGGLLTFDAFTNDLPDLLKAYNINITLIDPAKSRTLVAT